ncbi:uroporphyrinogen decarboxylase family protein [Kiritimatiella glycovorans]|uniref:Uroporphyrinogen decarboxylase (URO-D) domain-containing protein n=1 Tax=Kiritimatiella glycovorans TaxID=1307763 RepID=A0A0G3EFL9_9BACT|nr:uroporphyrinogen decarboxylase family protein [Kiritimatiella glycovorans]AKJ65261.1 hypothetical protein L21SP4_02028 [Kiritimatiella glycovorans]
MNHTFEPDYRHLVDAAYNREAARLPLYEHGFSVEVMEAILGREVGALFEGDLADKTEGFRRMAEFARMHGYDVVPFECNVVRIVQDGRGLCGLEGPLFESKRDIDAYPWDEKPAEFINRFSGYYDALRAALPEGMKAVGGVGNGIFEAAQDFVPFEKLAYLQVDDPEAYEALWQRVGDLQFTLWSWLLENHADSFAVCRFGDDLGFRSATLLQPEEIRKHVIPQYKRLIDLVHSKNKPFLLHSCGKIYEVMDDLIGNAGIDAKHSNEDAIDRFDVWVERYGDRIGNFGGVEMNVLCLRTPDEIRDYVRAVLERTATGHGGVALGSGNQISSYVPPEGFIAMTETVREWRGEG